MSTRRIDWEEFGHLLATVQHTAYRLEQQPTYAVEYEDDAFGAWQRGEKIPPPEISGLVEWFDQIREQTARGVRVERVRVHQDPPTDYQRWVRWVGRWNEEAGEVMRYTTPERASAAGLDIAGHDDWWLLDSSRILRMTYSRPGVATLHLVDDGPAVTTARAWWRIALRAAA